MKRKNRILLWGLLSALVGAGTIATSPVVNVVEVQAASSVSLSYTKTSSTEGRINVSLGSGAVKVLLPNGSTVTKNTSIVVKENKTYDFVSYDSANRPTQKSITVNDLDVDPAPLTTAHNLTIKLHVDAFDTISEMKDYRYRLKDSSNWSGWVPYRDNNSHDLKIPAPSSGSYIKEENVVIQARDHANNVRTVEKSFRIDNYHPEVQPFNEIIYTNTNTIRLPLLVHSYFKNPQQLTIDEGSKTTRYNLLDYQPKQTILERRPNLYRLDYENQLSYKIDTSYEGPRQLNYTVTKSYTDFNGVTRHLHSSDAAGSNNDIQVVYDVTKPTGHIEIVTDEKGEVPNHNVTINLEFYDEHGVEKVKVYRGNKEYLLTPEEVANGKLTIPWELGLTERSVFMEITDKAGNKTVIESNEVVISNIVITAFELTDVVNPAIYTTANPFEKKQWNFNGNDVAMLAGGNFTFKIYYDLGDVNPNRYNITGDYKVTIVDRGNIVYESEQIAYNPNDIPVGEHFNTDNEFENRGFETTFTIPSVDKNGKLFEDTAKVYLSTELKRHEKADGSEIFVRFEDADTIGNLIGTLGEYNGFKAIDDMLRFNQRN